MNCKAVETYLSSFIENDVDTLQQQEITDHLKTCGRCRALKEKIEGMMNRYAELEEDLPFFLKNRLYNIAEGAREPEIKAGYIRWVAAAIGTVVLFLNLFYFTNVYPSANRALHLAVSEIQKFVVETGAFFEKIKESPNNFLFGFSSAEPEDQALKRREESNTTGGENG